MEQKDRIPFRDLIRNFLVELVVYGGLIAVYFFVALRYLGEPLAKLYAENLTLYAIVGLSLIIVQAVILEFVTSFLFDFLGIHRLTK